MSTIYSSIGIIGVSSGFDGTVRFVYIANFKEHELIKSYHNFAKNLLSTHEGREVHCAEPTWKEDGMVSGWEIYDEVSDAELLIKKLLLLIVTSTWNLRRMRM